MLNGLKWHDKWFQITETKQGWHVRGSMLKAYKGDYMVAIQSKAWMTQMTKNRPLACLHMHKIFTKLGLNHARTRLKAQSMLRPKHGITRQVCKASMVCLN